MLFNSLGFIMFFPVVAAGNYICPKRYRYIWLLLASYVFYSFFGIECLFLLIGETLITYFVGLFIAGNSGHKRKWLLVFGIIACLGILGVFKYTGFILENINAVLKVINVRLLPGRFSILLPAGISFYIFKSLGYIIDVYKGRVPAEKNFLKYALFVSFFPQIIAGPIDRASNLIAQIDDPVSVQEEDVRRGAMLMLFGYFEKLIIADRLAVLVDAVFDNHTAFSGAAIMLAAVFYGIQIYADFAGYSHLAIGTSRILGFRVADNFRRPYFAKDIKDFWSRWHISMSTWFRDYVYIPLGGNRKGRSRQYINYMITFLLSGLWHGASWNFVAWGGLHGIYNCLSGMTGRIRGRIARRFGFESSRFSGRLIKGIVTFAMVDYAWMFFRAGSLSIGIDMTRRMITDFRLYSLSGDWMYDLGLSRMLLMSIWPAVVVLAFVDALKEKGVSIVGWLDRQGSLFRWICYVSAVVLVILAAVQNLGLDSGEFIYFRF